MVCDDKWDNNDVKVVCRELKLGFNGPSTGLLSNKVVGLFRHRKSLSACWHNGWGAHNCGHNEDAGVEYLGKL